MKFNVYGHFEVEVRREDDHWVAYSIALGTRARIDNLAIPEDLHTPQDIARYLDDMYHETARPGQSVSVIPD
jgi:hypothetical protein